MLIKYYKSVINYNNVTLFKTSYCHNITVIFQYWLSMWYIIFEILQYYYDTTWYYVLCGHCVILWVLSSKDTVRLSELLHPSCLPKLNKDETIHCITQCLTVSLLESILCLLSESTNNKTVLSLSLFNRNLRNFF